MKKRRIWTNWMWLRAIWKPCYLKQAIQRVSILRQAWRTFWAPFSFHFSYFIILAWVVFSIFWGGFDRWRIILSIVAFFGERWELTTIYCPLITLPCITTLRRRDEVMYRRPRVHAHFLRVAGCALHTYDASWHGQGRPGIDAVQIWPWTKRGCDNAATQQLNVLDVGQMPRSGIRCLLQSGSKTEPHDCNPVSPHVWHFYEVEIHLQDWNNSEQIERWWGASLERDVSFRYRRAAAKTQHLMLTAG